MASMVNTILRRKRFHLGWSELFAKRIIKCCCRNKNLFVKDKTWQRYRLLDKAEHMLDRRLDILELLKTVQRNQILLSAMLAPEQRLLLLYQRRFVVELQGDDNSSTSSSEAEQGRYTKKFQETMESSNYLGKIKALSRLTSILRRGYLEKPQELDLQDKKLMKGMYRRALNTYKFSDGDSEVDTSSDHSGTPSLDE